MARRDNPVRGDKAKGQQDMKTFSTSLVSSVCIIAALSWPQTSGAQLVFQTTFPSATCPDWNQTAFNLLDANVCALGDGIAGNGSWITSNRSGDQITAAANNSLGGGGKGFRHWVGDGLNNAGGGIVVSWAPVSEMWFRYYIRFQSGFAWGGGVSPNMKTIYCNYSQPGTFYFGLHDGVVGGHVEVDAGFGDPSGNHHSTVTWSQWQGGPTGNGNFHVLEVHAKMNTTGASSDGIFEFWLDGTRIYTNSNVHFSSQNGARFNNCKVGENHNNPQNGGVDKFVDFDDIAVSTTGLIGSPRNLRVQ
jgi:hypothetical protein